MTLASDPIVVLGAPRSGTTYLQRILDSHPEVALSNEVRLFEWLHRALAQADDDRALFEEREPFLAHLRAELPETVRRYYAARSPAARWWGDKNPHYAESAETLQTIVALFPGTRFVHIVRDPRAVLASLLNKRHADGAPWITHPEYAHTLIANHLDIATARREESSSVAFYELRYEDLVADDEGVARRLFEWLEIPFVEPVATFCRTQSGERTSFSGPTSDLQTAGDRNAAHAAWAAAVPPHHLRESLQFLAPHLLRFDYETAASLDAISRTLPPAGQPDER